MKRADDLLELPVRMRGIALGRAVDLLIDRERPRAIGFDVLCGDEAHRFLPFVAASLRDDAIEIDSPFLLLDFAQVDFYRHQATTLRELTDDRRDLVVGNDGTIQRAARPR
ncbi:MAG TPA: hypothetical protein VE757_05450 [Gaiellaceae bacterium]|nr:hypothetical protein [Gaiellaceae bacterium]